MVTDPLFYRLFETSPETLFLVLGMSVEKAVEKAERYQYEALEFKETSHRVDGVFRPSEPGLPMYFLEVQFYPKPEVYADLLAKAYTYLKQHDPSQPFVGVVLFATRSLEPKGLAPYQSHLDAGLVRPFYLDQLPALANAPLELSILSLIRETESEAPLLARALIGRARQEIRDDSLRADLIELIETVIIYKLPRLSREEIQAMLQVDDIRKTRVYQEAIEEGIEKGIEQGERKEQERQLQEKLRAIAKMAIKRIAAEDIADFLGLEIDFVRQQLAKN